LFAFSWSKPFRHFNYYLLVSFGAVGAAKDGPSRTSPYSNYYVCGTNTSYDERTLNWTFPWLRHLTATTRMVWDFFSYHKKFRLLFSHENSKTVGTNYLTLCKENRQIILVSSGSKMVSSCKRLSTSTLFGITEVIRGNIKGNVFIKK
jgi:hypothetical protein